jgi:hypothetical protein
MNKGAKATSGPHCRNLAALYTRRTTLEEIDKAHDKFRPRARALEDQD